MYDGSFLAAGFRNVSMNSDRRLVHDCEPLQIGRSGGKVSVGFMLWIFGSP